MLIIVLGIIQSVAYVTLLERKLMGSMQRRIGPNKVGYLGLLQPLMDGIKLILKENILPLYGNISLFLIAPFITFYLALANWLILPLDKDLSVSELEGGGILILIAITELGIFGVLYAGWSANSKYPLLGGLRSTAQMISYSVNLSLIILTIIFLVSDISLLTLLNSGSYRYLALLPMAFLFIISAIAETNRCPFDLPEASLLTFGLFKFHYMLETRRRNINTLIVKILYGDTISRKLNYLFDLNLINKQDPQRLHVEHNNNVMIQSKLNKNERLLNTTISNFYIFHSNNTSDLFKFIYKKSGIYGISNIKTNDLYIGSAINLEKRIKEHLKGKKSNILLQRAISKYGIENFNIIIYEILLTKDQKKLIELENYYIQKYKPTYNIKLTATSLLGQKHSEETKKKLSI